MQGFPLSLRRNNRTRQKLLQGANAYLIWCVLAFFFSIGLNKEQNTTVDSSSGKCKEGISKMVICPFYIVGIVYGVKTEDTKSQCK